MSATPTGTMSATPTAAESRLRHCNDSRASMREPCHGTAAGRSVDGTD